MAREAQYCAVAVAVGEVAEDGLCADEGFSGSCLWIGLGGIGPDLRDMDICCASWSVRDVVEGALEEDLEDGGDFLRVGIVTGTWN